MKKLKTFELFRYEGGNLPGVGYVSPNHAKIFTNIPKFEIKRNKYGLWNLYKNGTIFGAKVNIDNIDELDNQIRYVKDILRIQRKIKAQDIIVNKDLDNGIIEFNINQ